MGRFGKSNVLLKVLLVMLIILAIVSIFVAIYLTEDRQSQEDDWDYDIAETITYEGKKYSLRKNIETVLFIGVDKFSDEISTESYNNDQQADFLLLLIRDKKSGECQAIHINRDTMAKVRVLGIGGKVLHTMDMQIALSHTYGSGAKDSCLNTTKAVSVLLNVLKIDHYICISMDMVGKINDLVGGVEMYFEDDFSAIDESMVQGTTMTLTGEQALIYVRARGSMTDPTNIARMVRQRKYMDAWWATFCNQLEADEKFAEKIEKELLGEVVTDYTVDQINNMLEDVDTLKLQEIHSIEGEAVLGKKYMEFYPDRDKLQRLIVDLFYVPKE